MAQGVTIPLNIQGLKEAKAKLAAINKEWKTLSGSTQDYIKKKKALEASFYEQRDAIDAATDSMIELNSAGQLGGATFDDLNEVLFGTKEEIMPLSEQVTEMTKRMHQLAAAGDESSVEFKHLQEESARLQTIIVKTNDSVKGLVDNQGLGGLSHSLGEVGHSMMNLNFDEAAEQADHFSHQMGSLKKNAKGGFKSLAKSVGTVGKAFLKLGLSLLVNPLFLLVAVVVAIIAGMIALKDKVAFIGAIFDAIMIPINAVIQAFKDLLDWIGLTSFAEDEEKKKGEARWQEKKAQLADERRAKELLSKQREREFNEEQGNFDRQIALYEAQGRDVTTLRNSKIEAAITQKKVLLEEQRDRLKVLIIMADQMTAVSTLSKAVKQAAEEQAEAARLQISEMTSDIEDFETDMKIMAINASNDRVERKAEESDRLLQMSRNIQDLEIELLEEGVSREVEIINVKFARQIEDTLANEKIKQEEKDKLIFLFEEQRSAAVSKLLDDDHTKKLNAQIKLDDTLRAARNAQKDLATELEATEEEIELEKLRQSYAAKFEIAQGNFQLQIALKKDLIAAEDKLEKDQSNRSKKLKQDEISAKGQLAISGLQLVAGIADLFANKSEKAAKIAFNVQKAVSIAQATMNTYQAVSAALAQTTDPTPTQSLRFGNAIVAGVAGAIQVAKIASTKFQGGGSVSNSVPSSGVGGGGATSSAPSAPSFELFGQSNDLNNVDSPESAEQTINVNATVSETEMTETQSNIYNIQQASEL